MATDFPREDAAGSSPARADHVLAIGVDGGASGVRAMAVRRTSHGLLVPAGDVARRDHEPFAAVDLARQRHERASPRPDADEQAAARARVRNAADAIVEAADGAPLVALAVCWPGLKTPDGRGLAVVKNGPRDVGLLDGLITMLAARGVRIAQPVPPIASDGVAGALGESWSANGALRGVRDALYFAGGTGLAEAVLVAGRVRALDDLGLPKAWEVELDGPDGRRGTFEDAIAPGGWSRACVEGSIALEHEPERIRAQLEMAASSLVRYIQDRMRRLRDPAGIVPERAVVGARLGALFESISGARVGAHSGVGPRGHDRDAPSFEPLAEHSKQAGFPADFVRTSSWLEAPCVGAAALALGLEHAACPS